MTCKKIRRKKRSVCVGGLSDRITIYDRDIRPPLFNTSEQTQLYSGGKEVWSSVETTRGKEIFNGTQLLGVRTHIILLRFDPEREVTTEDVVEFKGSYYDILGVQNLEERDEWLELSCGTRGNKNQENNL